MKKHHIKISKFLSLVLRHKPEQIGIILDEAGWASVEELIQKASTIGFQLTPELIAEVVAKNDKQRFSLSPDGNRIRANQGHSIPVNLKLEPVEPPEVLFHGTATRFLGSILKNGLHPGSRQHVHLSPDEATAVKVGQRHGKPVVLIIDSSSMHNDGHVFYRSENNVWLTLHVPIKYIKVLGKNEKINELNKRKP
jgi:putative RNA 2'-phosphotransferase